MNVCGINEVYSILEEPSQDHLEICESTTDEIPLNEETKVNESTEKHCAVWNARATSILLKLYEEKLEMIETPKKKTRIWIAIAESLRDYNIEMTPDQIRWKINALTKKYKQCLDTGQHERFKYFKAMDNIYLQYNIDGDPNTATEIFQKKKDPHRSNKLAHQFGHEARAMIKMRKIRLANRIESDRFQGKIQLEKQWLEYLRKQEEQKQWRDDIYERNLRLREEELELRKRELEIKETLEHKKIQLMERELDDVLQIERKKCKLLQEMVTKR
ncbi:unnamed protein product [Arctia plantaginis]|uniref:Myb/SANT-like DNA-binding domain-containing protein n=1 Tax=Arctia plantaginis TaxID=874455 RepID=A0A8S1B1X0_ARCPL|nr:unnamed protein product [Arctia plantaginis]